MTAIILTKTTRRVLGRSVFISTAALFLLALFSWGKATAQSAAGPLPAVAPSDQPPQLAAPGSQSASAAKPNLAGTWKLNVDQSDNAFEKMREQQQDSGDGSGGRRGGFGGGGSYGGGGLGRSGGSQQNGSELGSGNRRRGGAQGTAELVIEQTPSSAKVSDSSGRVVALYQAQAEQSNAQSSVASENNSAPVAQWQDNKLITTVQMPNGGSTTRSYETSPDGRQLVVTTKIDNKRFKEPVIIRQLYDPVTASTGRN